MPNGSHQEYSGWVPTQLGAPWVQLAGSDGQRTVITTVGVPASTTVLYYNGGNVGPADLNVYSTNDDLDPTWKRFGTRDAVKNGTQIPCDEKPADLFTTRTSTSECETGDTTVTITNYRTNTTYELDNNFEWKPVVGDEFVVDTSSRPLNSEEQAKCQPKDKVEYGKITHDEITCDSTEFITRQVVTTTPAMWKDGKWVDGETVVTVDVSNRPLSSDELSDQKEKCSAPTTQPPTTQPPTTQPPMDAIVPPSTDAVVQFPPTPAPTTAVSAAGPTVPAVGALPATGSDGTVTTALIALLVTSLGGVALHVARRRNVTS